MASAVQGVFRVHTVESMSMGSTEWRSAAFIHHGEESRPVEWIADAGRSTNRDEARRQAIAAGVALVATLDPSRSRAKMFADLGLHEAD
ncbi:hypothetical protein ABWU93_11635 [Xanthomonas translucens pv. translucens]|uniref:hypothetical protein n=1 Tax=Xanthomonas campestris pv. translucens TaxID=343 RepID=UPI003F72FED5